MKYIEKLLNGAEVKWMPLGEVAEIGTGSSNRQDEVENGEFPFYVRSKNILRSATYQFDETAIVIPGEGGIGDIYHFVKGKYALHQRAYRVHLHNNNLLDKYVFHYMGACFKEYIISKSVGATATSIRKPMLEKFLIPIPPFHVQEEIVRILDKFTTLEAELEAELDCRKRQYEYYRNQLLSFDMLKRWGQKLNNIEMMTLGEMCSVQRGKRLTKRDLNHNGRYPVFHGGIEPIGYYSSSNREANSVMVINVGASAGTVGYSSKEFWSSDGCFCFSHCEQLNQKYLFYALQSMENSIKGQVRKAGIPTLDNKVVEKLKIPIPPLAEQQRIVSILDKFEALTTSISEGLPKEIALRRKQYEYYRNQLLSFA